MEEKTMNFSISNIQENIKDEKEKITDELNLSIIHLNKYEKEDDNDEDLMKLFDDILNIEKQNKKITKLEKDVKKKELKILNI